MRIKARTSGIETNEPSEPITKTARENSVPMRSMKMMSAMVQSVKRNAPMAFDSRRYQPKRALDSIGADVGGGHEVDRQHDLQQVEGVHMQRIPQPDVVRQQEGRRDRDQVARDRQAAYSEALTALFLIRAVSGPPAPCWFSARAPPGAKRRAPREPAPAALSSLLQSQVHTSTQIFRSSVRAHHRSQPGLSSFIANCSSQAGTRCRNAGNALFAMA